MLSTKQLTFNKEAKILIGEMSELEQLGVPQLFKQILVESHFTGQRLVFKFKESFRDNEGDITSYVYEPQVPCNVKQLIIFND